MNSCMGSLLSQNVNSAKELDVSDHLERVSLLRTAECLATVATQLQLIILMQMRRLMTGCSMFTFSRCGFQLDIPGSTIVRIDPESSIHERKFMSIGCDSCSCATGVMEVTLQQRQLTGHMMHCLKRSTVVCLCTGACNSEQRGAAAEHHALYSCHSPM